MAAVHQCPQCDLRFGSRPELEDHVRTEHGREDDDDHPSPDG